MDSNHSTVTIWQSGRLAPRQASRRLAFAFDREQWLGAALLVLAAVVLVVYVAVLERAVSRSEMARAATQCARAVAAAPCEADPAPGPRDASS